MATYEEIVKKTLEEIKVKVMRTPEGLDPRAALKIVRHDNGHIEPIASFFRLWLWIWERVKKYEEKDLFFLLRILKCDICCRILRNSPSSRSDFMRQNPIVQNELSRQANILTGQLVLADESGDEVKAEIIKMFLNKVYLLKM